ncbi:MAG: phospholipase D-like domain-containing protein [Gammaproteobacteria bacterium]|nr:phospholipase D-like domain-containing protein [Gammaproteobacteria bacterium]
MATKIQQLADEVSDIISSLPDHSIERILAAWDAGTKITKYNLIEISGVSGQKINGLMRIISSPNIDHRLLQSMITVARVTRIRSIKEANSVEMVWTGPGRVKTGIINTTPTIIELLRTADKSEKITIIDYRITHNAEGIIQELNARLQAGNKVEIIIDNSDTNTRELHKCFPKTLVSKPIIYTRHEKEHKSYKIHAKAIIIGSRSMLIGSANLTGLGTEVNFELGVLVRGPLVAKTSGLIEMMIKEGYFVRAGADG